MPNYKLSAHAIEDMSQVAKILLDRYQKRMVGPFPLSVNKLQQMMLPPGPRATILELERENPDIFRRSGYLERVIQYDTIPKPAIVQFRPRTPLIFYDNRNTYLDALTPDELAAFVQWINNGVQILRVVKLAKTTVNIFLTYYVGSTGQVLARWPALTMLADQIMSELSNSHISITRFNIRQTLRVKFSDRPKSLKPYKWKADNDWPRKYHKAMELTEMLLTSALMLPKDHIDEGEVKAEIISWVPAPGDLDKP